MMENRRRRKVKKQPAGTSVIVREQIQLLKAEKEIQEALKQIGQYRNRLIVEELELKANLARNTNQPVAPKVEPVNIFANYNKPDVINTRSINLHVADPDEEFDSD